MIHNMMKAIEQFTLRSWWVIVFAFICFFGFHEITDSKNSDIYHLKNRLNYLNNKISDEILFNSDLKLMDASSEDPEWIKLILIARMGVVPEGHSKVVFKKLKTK